MNATQTFSSDACVGGAIATAHSQARAPVSATCTMALSGGSSPWESRWASPRAQFVADPGAAVKLIARARDEARLAVKELRELARGIHPAVLTDRGLGAALEALAARAPEPVDVRRLPEERLNPAVEACAYFVTAGGADQHRPFCERDRGVCARLGRGRVPARRGPRRRHRRRRPHVRHRSARAARPRRRARRPARRRLAHGRWDHDHRRAAARVPFRRRLPFVVRTNAYPTGR